MINYRRLIADDDDPFETVIGHDGKPARVLKDGRSVRVRFRDAQAARGQAPAAHDGREPLTDQQRRDLQGCRPGFRTLDSAQLRERQQIARDAREIAEREMCEAWRNPPLGLGRLRDGNGFGSGGFVGAREGDQCTVRGQEYPDSFGAPGHLERRNGRLVCVPDDGDDDAASDSAFADNQLSDATERAYAAYAAEISQRWRRG
jgi:hypothetical protein